jgi:SAM-dependent methyltransferase
MSTHEVRPEINTTMPSSARVYNYLLGGKDHFPADRAVGDAIAAQVPTIRTMFRGQRAFLTRTVRYLVREAGIRQLLDVGTGIPSAGNVHDVAQELAPESRVLYVDNDPVVLAHSRALLSSTPEGRVRFILADLREPEAILADPTLPQTLDLSQPVGLILIGIMHHLRDDDDPRRIVATLVDALAPGSYLVLSQSSQDFDPRGDARPRRGVGAKRDPERAPHLRGDEGVLCGLGTGRSWPGAARCLAARSRKPGGSAQRLRLRRRRPQALSPAQRTAAPWARCLLGACWVGPDQPPITTTAANANTEVTLCGRLATAASSDILLARPLTFS